MLYSNYLKTEHWRKTREHHIKIQPSCVFCESQQNLQVHHKAYTIYDESILFKEENKNLYTVCASCHRLVHHYFGINVKKLNKKKLRVRRLLELGVDKKKAFWIVSTSGLYESLYDEIIKNKR